MKRPRCPVIASALLLLVSPLPYAHGAGCQESDAALKRNIQSLFQEALAEDNDTKQVTETKKLYNRFGLPTLNEVGDQAACEFVVLLASEHLSFDFRSQVALKLKDAAPRHEIPSEAATFYDASPCLKPLHPRGRTLCSIIRYF